MKFRDYTVETSTEPLVEGVSPNDPEYGFGGSKVEHIEMTQQEYEKWIREFIDKYFIFTPLSTNPPE